jgi:8-oxo-dGTP pyrophosphatase MutT (NUDIX family)
MPRDLPNRYVLGFLFTPKLDEVVLLRKLWGPIHIVGKLTGPGGHMAEGETPEEAMRREFAEEAAVDVRAWRHELDLVAGSSSEARWTCHVFSASSALAHLARTNEEEPVALYPVANLLTLDVVPNLRWIVPYTLDARLTRPHTITER